MNVQASTESMGFTMNVGFLPISFDLKNENVYLIGDAFHCISYMYISFGN